MEAKTKKKRLIADCVEQLKTLRSAGEIQHFRRTAMAGLDRDERNAVLAGLGEADRAAVLLCLHFECKGKDRWGGTPEDTQLVDLGSMEGNPSCPDDLQPGRKEPPGPAGDPGTAQRTQ